MGRKSLWDRIPVRENYKDVQDDFIRLKGPANVARCCFIFEISIAAIAFAVSFYISIQETTTVTSITYEPLGGEYTCQVLSPRSDAKDFSTATSEIVQFSSTRFLLDDCLEIFDADNLDVCNDGNHQEYILSVVGGASSEENCFDILLDNNYRYRLCEGSDEETKLIDLDTQFPRQVYSASVSSPSFYYANQNGVINSMTADFSLDDTQSYFYPHGEYVYVVSTDGTSSPDNFMYQFHPSYSNVAQLAHVKLNGGVLSGLVASNTTVFALVISSGTAYLTTYDLSSKTTNELQWACSTSGSSDPERSQYLALDETTGEVYFYCDPNGLTPFTYYRYDPADVTHSLAEYYVDMVSDSISFLVVKAGSGYFFGGNGPSASVLRVDLAAQPTPAPSAVPTYIPTTLPTGAPTNTPMPTQPPPPGSPPAAAGSSADRRRTSTTTSRSSRSSNSRNSNTQQVQVRRECGGGSRNSSSNRHRNRHRNRNRRKGFMFVAVVSGGLFCRHESCASLHRAMSACLRAAAAATGEEEEEPEEREIQPQHR
mmetsp:Transcript_18623/g.31372  ORF Transcript_18623/g.31372 Transcript_18623/m.31372 type:complete len:540 (-) Transcript_18623:2791-4410(-)